MIPGLVAGTPFLIVLQHYQPALFDFADSHPTLALFLSAIASAVFGMLTYDLGTHIEARWIDGALAKRDPEFESDWFRYLKLCLPERLVADGYIRDRVMYLHFELGMAAALPCSLIGALWAWTVNPTFTCRWLYISQLATAALTLFFWQEARLTAEVLAKVRKELVTKFDETPWVRLQLSNRTRDLALFNLGIDSKLRACDVVKLRVRDVCHGRPGRYTSDRDAAENATARAVRDHRSDAGRDHRLDQRSGAGQR